MIVRNKKSNVQYLALFVYPQALHLSVGLPAPAFISQFAALALFENRDHHPSGAGHEQGREDAKERLPPRWHTLGHLLVPPHRHAGTFLKFESGRPERLRQFEISRI